MLATCDILLRHTLQAGIEWYLDIKLQQAFKPQRLAELLNLLRGKYSFELVYKCIFHFNIFKNNL